MQMLTDVGADVNAEGGEYGNALAAASVGGHERVVQMLICAGAVNREDSIEDGESVGVG
jgi:ankyrin repeat domain-containing protein 50